MHNHVRVHVHDNCNSETLRKTKQHNTTQSFSKKNELPHVGFEPMTFRVYMYSRSQKKSTFRLRCTVKG